MYEVSTCLTISSPRSFPHLYEQVIKQTKESKSTIDWLAVPRKLRHVSAEMPESAPARFGPYTNKGARTIYSDYNN